MLFFVEYLLGFSLKCIYTICFWIALDFHEIFNPLLYKIHLYCEGKQCRSRSAGTTVPSDQDLHCSVLDSWVISDQDVNSADPDQMAQMCQLISFSTVYPHHKGIYIYGGSG
jgi:hypothetical protein